MPLLLAYLEKWKAIPPPMVSLLLLATAHGYKPKPQKSTVQPLTPTPKKQQPKKPPAERAAELQAFASALSAPGSGFNIGPIN